MRQSKEYFCWVKIARTPVAQALPVPGDALVGATDALAQGPAASGAPQGMPPAPPPRNWPQAAASDRQAGMQVLTAPRPPGVFDSDVLRAVLAGDIHTRYAPRPPGVQRQLAGYSMIGWWALDEVFCGVEGSGSQPEIHPVPGTREEALIWLDSSAGRAWVGDERTTLTYFLMVFGSESDA